MKKIILLILLPVLASAAENDVSVLSEDDTGKTYYRKFNLTPSAESFLTQSTDADMRDFLGLGTAAQAEVGDFAPAIVPWSALSGVPAAGTSTNGVVRLATGAEAETGTDTGKAIVPAVLASWWTWIKTQAQTLSGNWTFNGTSYTAPNQTAASDASLMTRLLGDTRYYNPLTWTQFPLNAGWTSTSSGSGTAMQQRVTTLALQSATTSDFGAITAYPNSSLGSSVRIGQGLGQGGYGGFNFARPVVVVLRMGSVFNFDPAIQRWAIMIGCKTTITSGVSSLMSDSSGTGYGYVGIECIGGEVKIVTQVGTAAASRSTTIDTWSANQNHKCYVVSISGGTVTVVNGFTGVVLGSHSGAPTTSNLVATNAPVAVAAESTAAAATVPAFLNIYQIAINAL